MVYIEYYQKLKHNGKKVGQNCANPAQLNAFVRKCSQCALVKSTTCVGNPSSSSYTEDQADQQMSRDVN